MPPTSPKRILIIGAGAAGASAAARLRRLDETAEITILDKSPDVSVASCGMPYFIGGEISDRSRMALHTPASLSGLLNLTIVSETEAVAIDRTARSVRARNAGTGEESVHSYDKLILATGAAPRRPQIPGVDDSRVRVLRTLGDMDGIRKAAADAKQVVVIGAGFIGLEMAEQLHHGGREVIVVELAPQVLPPLDPDMAAHVAAALDAAGVTTFLNEEVAAMTPTGAALEVTLRSGKSIPADLVILSAGVQPDTALAAQAGVHVSSRGHIVVDEFLRTSDPDIYAAGDAVELFDRQTGERSALPMGGPANRQGRAIADAIAAPEKARPYPGHLGTAIVRVFGMVAAMTGHSEKRLKAAGSDYRKTLVTDYNHASYYPGATPITIKLLWCPNNGRVLGAQAVGAEGVDKRIDVIATAIAGKMTIDDLAELELCYAPPFGSARDVVNTAGFVAQNARQGLVQPVDSLPSEGTLIDVRPAEMAALSPLPRAINIPLPQLRQRAHEIDPAQPITTICALGKTSYFAARILAQRGFTHVSSLAGGLKLLATRRAAPQTPASPGACHTAANSNNPTSTTMTAATSNPPHANPVCGAPAPEALTLDACGLACPGPLLKVREASSTLAPGQLLVVKASDPGFTRDIEAFATSNGFAIEGCTTEKGVITARLRKPSGGLAPVAHDSAGRRKGATLVVFSGDWDKVMASLVIANGAAAMGGPVTMFFTFWGLNALRKEQAVSASGKTFLDKMFGKMMPRGLGKLGLSKMNMAGIGNPMFTWRMKQLDLPNPHGLMDAARKGGIRVVACSMSMDAMGLKKEELLDGVEIGGVADFLGAAETTGTNLFI
jgi:NADPH-dependent 2,4-dienoyl-CoA reductase/sulfur reductase-like enzyme/peroxiredoxin family protein/TusA-related sulfurtransferase/rhodanese-related sulfurtransferase